MQDFLAKFAEFEAKESAEDQAAIVTVAFEYDEQLVALRRDAAPSGRFDRQAKIWRVRRDEAWNLLRSADHQCTERGVEKEIVLNGQTVTVGCPGAESAALAAVAEARAEKKRADMAEADRLESERRKAEALASERERVKRLTETELARIIIMKNTTKRLKYEVRTLDGKGDIDAMLVTADGQRIWITGLLEDEEVRQSRRVSVRYLKVPVLTGGHHVVVTVNAPNKKPSRSAVRLEEEELAA
jgi:hypothetical protein